MAIEVAAELSDRTYEGPFELLLQLILAEEVDLYEVSLARIVDAYLAEIERLQALDLDVATEFLLIAATLVELKARRLLPGRADVDLDEELALWEERDLLLARIDLFHVAPIRLSVADALVELAFELPRAGRITFSRLTSDLAERLEVIVRFLAVLELYKQGLVELDQADRCGEITIEWIGDADTDVAALAVDAYEG